MTNQQSEQLSALKTARELSERMQRKFIADTLKANGGSLTFTPENPNSIDTDDYHVVSTFFTDYGNPNIGITKVYLSENDEIYAEGVDIGSGSGVNNLEVLSAQYPDVITFIQSVLEIDELDKPTFSERVADLRQELLDDIVHILQQHGLQKLNLESLEEDMTWIPAFDDDGEGYDCMVKEVSISPRRLFDGTLANDIALEVEDNGDTFQETLYWDNSGTRHLDRLCEIRENILTVLKQQDQ